MKKKKKSGSPAKYFIGLIALFLVMAGGLTLVKAGGGSASLANADSSKSLAAVAALTPVPTSPTVTLKSGLVSQIYSKPDGGQLKMSFSLVITNNTGSTIYIPKSYSPFWPSFINTTRGNVIGDPACMPSSGPTSLVPLVWDYSKTNSYLQLNAGQTINYLVTKACNINQMFAGKYTARLGDITWTTSMAPTMIMQSASTNIVSSNSQLIVGETGPWISGVQVSEKNSDVVYIFGERLLGTEKNPNKFYIGSKEITVLLSRSDSQIVLSLSGNGIAMGSYPVYIVNPIIGKSNTVSVSVGMIDCSATPNSVKDYYTQTSVRGLVACRSAAGCLSGFTPDVCVDTTKLNKYYCENGKKWVEMNHLCSKGCSGGACKR